MRVLAAVLALVILGACAVTPQAKFERLSAAASAGDRDAQYRLGRMYYRGEYVSRDYAQSAAWFRKAANAGHVRATSYLASQYIDGKGVPQDYAKAVHLLEGDAVKGDVICLNCLAWLLATCPDDRVRDGKRAVELAQRLVAKDSSAAYVDTLAAAYAAAGRFGDAIRTQNLAIEKLKKEEHDVEELSDYVDRLVSYRNRKPWLKPSSN